MTSRDEFGHSLDHPKPAPFAGASVFESQDQPTIGRPPNLAREDLEISRRDAVAGDHCFRSCHDRE
jgi:hypothetical protein